MGNDPLVHPSRTASTPISVWGEWHGTNVFLSATVTGFSEPTSSTTAANEADWGAPGIISTSRRSVARRSGEDSPAGYPANPKPTSGGTGTIATSKALRPRQGRLGRSVGRPERPHSGTRQGGREVVSQACLRAQPPIGAAGWLSPGRPHRPFAINGADDGRHRRAGRPEAFVFECVNPLSGNGPRMYLLIMRLSIRRRG